MVVSSELLTVVGSTDEARSAASVTIIDPSITSPVTVSLSLTTGL
jgi:hypothetical protein